MSRFSLLILFFIFINYQNVGGRLPPYIKTCSRNHPNMANCILNSINSLRGVLSSGQYGPGFENLPKIEPFYIHSINIGNRREFKAHLSNIIVRGGSNFQIEKLKANMRDLKFDAIVKFPRLEISSKYDLVFNLFGLALAGKGDGSSIIDNSRGRISIRARRYIGQDGREYLNFEKFNVKVQVGVIKSASLSSFFNGKSPILEEIANQIIRTQPEFLIQEIYPPIENHLAETFTTIANKFSNLATFDEVFPL
ncbi:hypothetical protein PVAND_012270 [Polypedilum vanderplanki]|uniref:Hemolymph juvenile hormone binding protein n=1 Tax=Polypedilum vanderplanki TaxID=319348 RepID=A0A9J6CL30_POLVA|nr:hypothetical protein PVAND_012270 [Polypedilum vanderplanki]